MFASPGSLWQIVCVKSFIGGPVDWLLNWEILSSLIEGSVPPWLCGTECATSHWTPRLILLQVTLRVHSFSTPHCRQQDVPTMFPPD
jgi:hypothetical protein